MSGYSDTKVMMRYAHLSPWAILEAVDVVGNMVGHRVAEVSGRWCARSRWMRVHPIEEAPNWELDGVTLQVRFGEEPETNPDILSIFFGIPCMTDPARRLGPALSLHPHLPAGPATGCSHGRRGRQALRKLSQRPTLSTDDILLHA